MTIKSQLLGAMENFVNRTDAQAELIYFLGSTEIERQNIEVFLHSLSERVAPAIGAKTCTPAFGSQGSIFLLKNDLSWTKLHDSKLISRIQTISESAQPIDIGGADSSIIINVSPSESCFVLLVLDVPSESDREFDDFTLRFLAQISELTKSIFDSNVEKRTLKTVMALSRRMMEVRDIQEDVSSTEKNLQEAPRNRAWNEVLRSVIAFLPTWGPSNILDAAPRAQLLTTNNGNLLRVRSESSLVGRNDWRTNSSVKSVKRDRSVCGWVMDEISEGADQSYWLENPKLKHPDRYASLLFGEVPETELIVPFVRSSDSDRKQVISFLNIESLQPDAFSEFQVISIVKFFKRISHFTGYLFDEERRSSHRDRQMTYSLLRMAKRLSKTLGHKTNGGFGKVSSGLEATKRQLNKNDSEAALEKIENSVHELDNLQGIVRDYLGSLVTFVKFGKHFTRDLAKDTVITWQTQNPDHKGDNIEISLVDEGVDGAVFASGLVKEQISNVLDNSCHQIVIARKDAGRDFIGKILVSTSKDERSAHDNAGEKVSLLTYTVSIEDNGGGMSEEAFERAFEEGFTTKATGTGFGLRSARDYMRTLGGDVRLENRPGRGLTVHFDFSEYDPDVHVDIAKRMNAETSQ